MFYFDERDSEAEARTKIDSRTKRFGEETLRLVLTLKGKRVIRMHKIHTCFEDLEKWINEPEAERAQQKHEELVDTRNDFTERFARLSPSNFVRVEFADKHNWLYSHDREAAAKDRIQGGLFKKALGDVRNHVKR